MMKSEEYWMQYWETFIGSMTEEELEEYKKEELKKQLLEYEEKVPIGTMSRKSTS